MVAASETHDRQQCKAVVRRCLAEPDSQAILEVLLHSLVAHDPAAHAVADHDDVAPHRLAENEVVKGGHAIDVRRGHTEMSGNVADTFIRDPAAVPLNDL